MLLKYDKIVITESHHIYPNYLCDDQWMKVEVCIEGFDIIILCQEEQCQYISIHAVRNIRQF